MTDGQHDELATLEWHDLPVASLSIQEDGIEIQVTPYDDDTSHYTNATLRLWGYTTLQVDLAGTLTLVDQARLEIADFTWELDGSSLLSGSLGMLPGHAGYWRIAFTEAQWSLRRADPIPD